MCKPMFNTYQNTPLLRVCVPAFLSCMYVFYAYFCITVNCLTGNCQWLASSLGELVGLSEEGQDALLPCCPLSPEFWQLIRGEQIRPHTCFMFGEPAVCCLETDAVDQWEEWTLHFLSPVFLHLFCQGADLL